MLEWVEKLTESMGYTGVVLLMFLENVFPPIPSEVIMPLAGFAAGRGELSLIGVIIAGMIGSVLGALPLYWLGRAVSADRLKRWADRYGGWLAVKGDDVDKATGWFDRYGGAAVFFCRLVPGVRSLISIPAGMCGMSMVPFLTYTAVGTGIWAAILAVLGYMLGENYGVVERYLAPVSKVVLVIVGVLLVVWIVRRVMKARREPAADAPEG